VAETIAQMLADLPRVPRNTLEIVKERFEEADQESMELQRREFLSDR
jgi:hypothetical protein